jgi:hypothetical protein
VLFGHVLVQVLAHLAPELLRGLLREGLHHGVQRLLLWVMTNGDKLNAQNLRTAAE